MLLDDHGHGRVTVRSAGSAPGDEINPAGKSIEEVRPIVDEIERRVLDLLAELGVQSVAC